MREQKAMSELREGVGYEQKAGYWQKEDVRGQGYRPSQDGGKVWEMS